MNQYIPLIIMIIILVVLVIIKIVQECNEIKLWNESTYQKDQICYRVHKSNNCGTIIAVNIKDLIVVDGNIRGYSCSDGMIYHTSELWSSIDEILINDKLLVSQLLERFSNKDKNEK